MRQNNSQLYFDEVYSGEMNPLRLTTENRKVFACNFFNMNYYPFGDQWCSFTLQIERSSNEQTNLILNYLKNKVYRINQYTIRKWQWEKVVFKNGTKQAVKVSVLLERKLTKIFLVTYLPTILMNIINQVR